MRYIKSILFIVILVTGLTAPQYAYFSRFLDVPKDSREYQLLLSPQSFSLREGGLLASGVSPDNMKSYLIQMDNIMKEIKESIDTSDQKEKSAAIFDLMHKTVLKKYNRSSTTLDVALKRGEFNCLSSTLLYNILMEENNIEARTMVLPTHTYSLLQISTNTIDVENTTPLGYDVASNPEAQKNLKKLTGYSYSDAKKEGEVVGKKGLIAYTYANRAYFADKAGQHYLAFQNALKAYALYPEGKNIYTNVSAGFSSYSYHLISSKKDYKKAMAILEEAIEHFPVKDDFVQNYKAALDKYLNELIEQGEYDDAFAVFKRGQEVTGLDLPRIQENLFTRLIYRIVNKEKDFEKAYEYARIAYGKMSFSENIKGLLVNGLNSLYKELKTDWKNHPKGEDLFLKWYKLMDRDTDFNTILESYYSKIALQYYEAGDLKTGISVIDKGLSHRPGSDVLRNNGAYMTSRTAVDYLNKKDYNYGIYYVKLTLKYIPTDRQMLQNLKVSYREWVYSYIDQGKYKTALKIVTAGLEDVPDDPKLLEYRNYIKKKIK